MDWQRQLDEYLDILVAICAIGGGLLVVGLSAVLGLGQYGLGFAFIIGPVAYILHRQSPPQDTAINLSSNVFYAITGIWTVAIVLATLTAFRSTPGLPLLHYVAATTAFAIILADILYHRQAANSQKSALRIVILAKMIVTSVIYRTGRFWSVNTIPGNDIHKHLDRAAIITETGFTPFSYDPVFGKYVGAPIFHIILTTLSRIGLTEQQVVFTLVVFFAVVTALISYQLGNILATPEVGLFTALFVSVSSFFILRGVASITPSLITLLLFMTLLSLLYQQRLNSKYIHLAAFGLLFLISLTHHLSMLVVMVILSSIYLGILLARDLPISIRYTNAAQVSLAFVIAGAVALVLHLTLTPSFVGTLFERGISRLVAVLESLGASSGGYAAALSNVGFVSNILYNLGQSMILCMGIIGILTWTHRDYRSDRRFGILFGILALFVIIYPGTLIGLDRFLVPHRILVFLMLFISICAGVGVSNLCERSNRTRLLTGIFIVVLIFASLTAPFIIEDDPVYSDDRVHRASLTDSEMGAHLYASSIADGRVMYVDPLVRQPQIIPGQRQAETPRYSNFRMYPQDETWQEDSIVVVREMYRERGYKFGVPGTFSAGSSASYSPRPLQNCEKSLVYETNSTEVYHLPNGCGL